MPDGVVAGFINIEEGRVVDWGEGEPERGKKPDAQGWVMAAPVNAHTHVGDSFLRDVAGKPRDLAGLVGPEGWKHERLTRASPVETRAGIERYVAEMAACGTSRFIDFREGGVAGAQLLRDIAADLPVEPFMLGRPAANGFDEVEAREILGICDGIGLSAARDFDRFQDVEAWAEICHKARKPFAIHVSEAKHEPLERILNLEPAFLVHACQSTKREMQAAADMEVPVVVCPRSNAWFGIRTPVAAMLDAGLTLAIGTDNGMLTDGDLVAELATLRAMAPRLSEEALLRMATAGRALVGLGEPLPPRRGAPMDLVVYPDPLPLGGRSLKPGFVVPDAT